jgi:single-stranded-DNA-specific exonuclease
MIKKKDLHPVIKRLLKKRGVSTASEINEFFSTDLKELPDLTEMIDMDKASKRLVEAIKNNEKIGIYGDYDVDGTTSCAVLYQFFKMIGVEVDLQQPSRFIEGYGIHPPAIDKAIEKGIKVLVTVDLGITNNETADYVLDKDLDLIITDHHSDIREEIPNAYAVVNPNRRDEPKESPRKALAGVGVAFSLCLAIKRELERKNEVVPSIYPLLQFVAIGTIADLAPLNNMNRKLVSHGLKQIPQTKYEGIKAFLKDGEKNLPSIPSEKVGFGIGPFINSKGRLDHPKYALEQLIAVDEENAIRKFVELEECNDERKEIQKKVFDEAKEQIIKTLNEENYINIVYAPDWHEGVIGIVASKLVDTFKKPAIVFTDSKEEGIIKASARSAGDLDLFDSLKKCSDYCTKFGGHKSAAGMSMEKVNLEGFKKKMNELLSVIPEELRTVGTPYDIEVGINEIDLDLVKQLSLLEPFGMGNTKPIFKMSGISMVDYQVLKDVHVKWKFQNEDKTGQRLEGISFNHITNYDVLMPDDIWDEQIEEDKTLEVYFEVSINVFRGYENLQLMVRDIKWEE